MLSDKNLKAIVCMSNACESTLEKLLCEIPKNIMITNIYPYVPNNRFVNENYIVNKCSRKIKCLFIAQGIRFLSKGGLELVYLFERFKNKNIDIELTIISNKSCIDENILNKIYNLDNINLVEFKLSYDELEIIYMEHSILLHPTSDDSFGVTILEAMKYGLPIISTKLYAVPEMVEDGFNGFLTNPKYWFSDENNISNPKVWNNRKKL